MCAGPFVYFRCHHVISTDCRCRSVDALILQTCLSTLAHRLLSTQCRQSPFLMKSLLGISARRSFITGRPAAPPPPPVTDFAGSGRPTWRRNTGDTSAAFVTGLAVGEVFFFFPLY